MIDPDFPETDLLIIADPVGSCEQPYLEAVLVKSLAYPVKQPPCMEFSSLLGDCGHMAHQSNTVNDVLYRGGRIVPQQKRLGKATPYPVRGVRQPELIRVPDRWKALSQYLIDIVKLWQLVYVHIRQLVLGNEGKLRPLVGKILIPDKSGKL